MKEDRIQNITSSSQLTHAGFYSFDKFDESIHTKFPSFTDYDAGDFHCLLIGSNVGPQGCAYGSLLIFTPRRKDRFWVATIWDREFINFYKVGT